MSMQPGPDEKRRRPITVGLVDDEELIRTALAYALADDGLVLGGDATSTQAALNIVVDLRPDVVLMDLNAPGMPGVEAIEHINLLAPASRILVLTRPEQNQVVEAIIAGASGYILKTASTDAIVAAVRSTAGGESVIAAKIAGKLLDRIRERDISSTVNHEAAGAIRATLTMRELEIFTKLASGKSNQAIGLELSLSTSTVSNHIVSILAKLQLENRVQAAVQAVRSGIA